MGAFFMGETMSDVIGRGVIEVSADSTKLKAGIEDAKRSVKGLGTSAAESSGKASRSIDAYIKKLETQNVMFGMSARQAEQYRLGLRGATAEQIRAAEAALDMADANSKTAAMQERVKIGLIAAAAAATAAAGAIAAMVISSIDAADNLNDLSKKTGISVEQLSGLSLAAEQSGADLDGVAESINKLSVNIGKDGDKFRALGITAKEPLEAFKQLADIFSAIDDPQTRAALGAAALGKSWQGAAPLLAEGGKNIGEMVEKGMRLSGVTQDMADDADRFNDSMADLKATTKGLGNEIAKEMLPAFNRIIEAIKFAYEDSGKLKAIWVALGALGAFAFTNEFSSASVKIKDLKKDLEGLESDLSLSKNAPAIGYVGRMMFGNTTDVLEKKVADTKRQIASLEESMKPKAAPAGASETPEQKARREKAEKEALDRANRFIASQKKDAARAADELAKARLDSDIANIKKNGDATSNALGNAEKILEARRAAGLVSEKEYSDAKLGFINLNREAQERALQSEIARYQAEETTGKRKFEADKNIAEAQAALAKVRADGTAAATAHSIAEEAANARIAKSYVDAAKAAQAYIDTVKKQDAREIAGFGKGDKFRADQSARGEISDQRDAKRRGLRSDLDSKEITQEQHDKYLAIVNDTYAQEVSAYESRSQAMKELHGNWALGANEAFENYLANAQNVAGQSAEAFSTAFQGMEDGVASSISRSIVYGENLGESLKNVALSIADTFITSFIKIGIQKLLVDKAVASLYAGTIAAQSQAMVAMAGLNAFASTAAIPIVGPAAAPAAAAAAAAIAQGFALTATAAAAMSVASASGGYDIPAGVNPLTQLHQREMVLPAQHADTIRRLGKEGGSGGGGSGPVHVTYSPTIQIDGSTDMGRNQKMIREAVVQGNADLVDKLVRAGRI
jgi:lambda family phage tail tape measure protein